MNFLSHYIGPLFHQHRSNPCAELARHGNDGDARTHMPRVSATYGGVELPKLSVLANRRPGRLDEFTPASWRTFLSPRQSPIRARSWLATIQPMPQTLII
jgi:hypothetical protein